MFIYSKYDYEGHELVSGGTDRVFIFRDGIQVDWIYLPGQGVIAAYKEAMRKVREEHNALYRCELCSTPIQEDTTFCNPCYDYLHGYSDNDPDPFTYSMLSTDDIDETPYL